jgi:uncharacterized membrane protein
MSAAAGVSAGVVVGMVTVTIDAWATGPDVVDPDAVRATFAGLVGGLMTLAVFTLWMRTVVVGLASSQFSPRILTAALGDRFQQRILAVMIGAVAAALVIAVRLPVGSLDGAPVASLVVSAALVVLGLAAVLIALRDATTSLALPRVVAELATTALASLEVDVPDDDLPLRRRSTTARLTAEHLGWVRSIHRRRILETLPPGTCAELRIDVGSLVAEGDVLIELDAGGVEPHDLLAAIDLRSERCPHRDPGFAIQQLADVALHALQPGSMDGTTAHEAIQHLGIVLERLLVDGLPSGHLVIADRAVVAGVRWRPEDHLQRVVDPLVIAAGGDPIAARHLEGMLSSLQELARALGDDRCVEVLQRQQRQLHATDGWSVTQETAEAPPSHRRQPVGHPLEVGS